MNYNFQLLPKKPLHIDGTLKIGKHGRIGLTKDFVEENGIHPGTNALLYLDTASNAIAIEFTDIVDPRAGKVKFVPKNQGAFISVGDLFSAAGLDANEYANRYRYQKQAGSEVGLANGVDVFVIDLTKPID